MSNTQFRTMFTNPKKLKYEGCVNNEERKVDTLGFIPHNVKIENYINAGIKLAAARAEQYDGDANVKPEDIPHNPFRDIGMDLVDVQRAKQKIEDSLKASIKRQEYAAKMEQERQKMLAENAQKELVEKRVSEELKRRSESIEKGSRSEPK